MAKRTTCITNVTVIELVGCAILLKGGVKVKPGVSWNNPVRRCQISIWINTRLLGDFVQHVNNANAIPAHTNPGNLQVFARS